MSTITRERLVAGAPPKPVGADLEALLEDYVETYERLRATVTAHRAAIQAADAKRAEAMVVDHQGLVARITQLDQSRRSLIANAMRDGLVAPGRDARLSDVAAALPEPQRSHLVQMAHELKELVKVVQAEQSGLRLAAGALASHMQGLMQHVARKLSHAGVYSKRGVVEGLVLASALDIRQ